MARWLGIDHGTSRVGLAAGDDEGQVASPLGQLDASDPALAERIADRAREYGVAGLVVGWPINDDGSEGRQGRLAREFAVGLARATGMEVRLWDERLSSFEADVRLRGRLTRRKKKRRHDAVAAAAFLEDFLSRRGPEKAPRASEAAPPEAT